MKLKLLRYFSEKFLTTAKSAKKKHIFFNHDIFNMLKLSQKSFLITKISRIALISFHSIEVSEILLVNYDENDNILRNSVKSKVLA